MRRGENITCARSRLDFGQNMTIVSRKRKNFCVSKMEERENANNKQKENDEKNRRVVRFRCLTMNWNFQLRIETINHAKFDGSYKYC